MAYPGGHKLQMQQEGAAAAVAALYFCCLVGTAFNVKLTGFKLYIPLSIAAAVRAVSFAARAAFYATGNVNLMAVNRATQAVGLGISIAMCCCFLIIWLRSARPHHQPPALTVPLTMLCKVLIACVIALGPVLGIAGAAAMGARPTDPQLQAHVMQIRKASTAGFLAVISALTLCTACIAFNWLRGAASSRQPSPPSLQKQQLQMPQAHSGQQQQQQAQQQNGEGQQTTWRDEQGRLDSGPTRDWQQQLRGNGLILLLLVADALLLWGAAALVASLSHPRLQIDAAVYYPVMVLPELLVAALWAMPTLAARVALGARYSDWRQQQAVQRRAAKDAAQQHSGKLSAGSDDAVDAEVGAVGVPGNVKATV